MSYKKIILSSKGYISTEALSLLSQNNRNVILLDTYGKPITYLNPAKESLTATQYRVAQYDAFRDESKRECLARQIILAKKKSQLQLLYKIGSSVNALPDDEAKARILLEKLKQNNYSIKIENKKDGIFSHDIKLNVFSEEADIPEDDKMILSVALGDQGNSTDYLIDPFVIALVESETDKLKDQIKERHQDRLDCSFVNFDFKTGEPYLGHRRSVNEMKPTLEVIEGYIINLRRELDKL